MKRTHVVLLLLVHFISAPCVLPASAQDTQETESTVPLHIASAATSAIMDLQAGDVEASLHLLEKAFTLEPAWQSNAGEPVAYWLGKAYYDQGKIAHAIETWKTGAYALSSLDASDIRLEMALMESIFTSKQQKDYGLGANLYLRVLEQLGTKQSPVTSLTSFQLYGDALFAMLSPSVKAQFAFSNTDDFWNLDGSALSTWWRSQDPAPATRINERLIEHLERIAHAKTHYVNDDRFDDRGLVYIRLGEPAHTTSVDFSTLAFRKKVLDQSLTINESDFPLNEFWYYDRIDESAYFLFHNRSGTYRIGQADDLLPMALRTGVGPTDRGKSQSEHTIRTLEEIYRQLSMHHPDYGIRYQDVASFSSLLDQKEVASETAEIFQEMQGQSSSQTIRTGSSADLADVSMPGSAFNTSRPDLFVHHFVSNSKVTEESHRALRETYVPQTRTSAFDALDAMPLHVRHARFLDPDGSTRTEVYWAAPSGAFELEEASRGSVRAEDLKQRDHLLVTSTVQKTRDYRDRAINHQRLLIPNAALASDISLGNRVLIARGDTGMYHLAVQWDQYLAEVDPSNKVVDLGPKRKSSVYQQDSLLALSNDPGQLEMSDLRPMIIPNMVPDKRLRSMAVAEGTEPIFYPVTRISPDLPLMLYFEIYHLTYSADQTQYTIEYTIEKKPGGLRLRRRRGDTTSFRSTQQGSERTVQEQVMLDLSDWRGNGEIDIRVTITDEHTGQQVQRNIRYELDSKIR